VKSELAVSVAPELALFLRPGQRSGPVRVTCDGVSTLGHVVESLGVPLTEVGGLVVNGSPAGPGYRPEGGDIAHVQAMPRPQRVDSPVFLLDVHLGTVARRLRLVGVDAAYDRDADDDELISRANAGRRVLLTQDRGLLRRHRLWLGAYVRGTRPDDQFADVLSRFAPPLAPWTRCTACNGVLVPAAKADVASELEPGTRRTYDSFSRCESCGRVYWRGAHGPRLQATVDAAIRIVGGAERASGARALRNQSARSRSARSDGSGDGPGTR
jgi:uncharacterized protein